MIHEYSTVSAGQIKIGCASDEMAAVRNLVRAILFLASEKDDDAHVHAVARAALAKIDMVETMLNETLAAGSSECSAGEVEKVASAIFQSAEIISEKISEALSHLGDLSLLENKS